MKDTWATTFEYIDVKDKTTFQLCFPEPDEIIIYRCGDKDKYFRYLLTPSLKIIKLERAERGYTWYDLTKIIEECENEYELADKFMVDLL